MYLVQVTKNMGGTLQLGPAHCHQSHSAEPLTLPTHFSNGFQLLAFYLRALFNKVLPTALLREGCSLYKEPGDGSVEDFGELGNFEDFKHLRLLAAASEQRVFLFIIYDYVGVEQTNTIQLM